MSNIEIRKIGSTGRITLTRERALNALTLPMIEATLAALPRFAADDEIKMLVIDAAGEKAFCAGGDIADIYEGLVAGEPDLARRFWRTEYRMNHALFTFPKPVAVFMQGFTMGGGVGMACHGSHRVVGATSRVALPECGIGLIPDVGGTLLLARAPGRLGEYLGTTATRMGPGDAVLAGFADYFIPEDDWPGLITTLEESGDWRAIDAAAGSVPMASLTGEMEHIDRHFGGERFHDILNSLEGDDSDWARKTLERLSINAPLAMACAVEGIHRARLRDRMDEALRLEYRFAHRIVELGDFREGIRAAIIDRDKTPTWRHASMDAPTYAEVAAMLQPLGPDELTLEE